MVGLNWKRVALLVVVALVGILAVTTEDFVPPDYRLGMGILSFTLGMGVVVAWNHFGDDDDD